MLDATEDRRIPRRADRRIFCGSNRRPQEGSGGSSFAAPIGDSILTTNAVGTSASAGCGHSAALAHGSSVPILLQKSFCAADQKFFWP
jgi:hypothetical protein